MAVGLSGDGEIQRSDLDIAHSTTPGTKRDRPRGHEHATGCWRAPRSVPSPALSAVSGVTVPARLSTFKLNDFRFFVLGRATSYPGTDSK